MVQITCLGAHDDSRTVRATAARRASSAVVVRDYIRQSGPDDEELGGLVEPVNVLTVVRQRWKPGVVGFLLGGTVGLLLAAGLALGEGEARASGEIFFRSDLVLVGDELVDGRSFSTVASANAIFIVKTEAILEPVVAKMIDGGIVDSSTTASSLSEKVSAEVPAGSSNLKVTARDADPERAVLLAEGVMVELAEYLDQNAPLFPDGTKTFSASVGSEPVEAVVAQGRMSSIAIVVVLGLLAGGAAVALRPVLNKTVYDDIDVRAISRRAFGSEATILSVPKHVRRTDDALSSWLVLLFLSNAQKRARRVALVVGCGLSDRPQKVAEEMATRMRESGHEIVVLDLDSDAHVEGVATDMARVRAVVEDRASQDQYVIVVSARLDRGPELALVALNSDSTFVLAERHKTRRKYLFRGLQALSLTGRTPVVATLLD